MNKIIAGFMVMFVLLSILSAIMDGAAGAAASTDLTAAIDDDDVTLNVTSVTGFLAAGGVVMVGNEKILYTGVALGTQFTGCTRGYEGTIADDHANGTAVYNEDLGIVNYAMGFNVVQTGVPGSIASVAMMPIRFLTITVPRLVLWDYAFLQGDLVILRYVLMAISVGFVIYLAFMAVNTIIGVLSKVI